MMSDRRRSRGAYRVRCVPEQRADYDRRAILDSIFHRIRLTRKGIDAIAIVRPDTQCDGVELDRRIVVYRWPIESDFR